MSNKESYKPSYGYEYFKRKLSERPKLKNTVQELYAIEWHISRMINWDALEKDLDELEKAKAAK